MSYLTALIAWFRTLATPYPARDWCSVLIASAVLCAAHASLAASLFIGAQTGSILASTTALPTPPKAISRDAVKLAIESYQVRAANFVAKNFTGVRVSDPRPPKTGK